MTLELPSETSDYCKLADWVELKTLCVKDRNVSLQDLIAELRRSRSVDAVPEDESTLAKSHQSEELACAAFDEIGDRNEAAGTGYPFKVEEEYIQLKFENSEVLNSTYIFQLLVSFLGVNINSGVDTKTKARVRPEREFEDISLDAAQGYFGRNEHDGSYLFAFPRRTDEASFPTAVDELCLKLGEGGGVKPVSPAKDQKDAHLDLVVWHGFADHRSGQLIAFGQCASGRNWRSKLNELPVGDIWCRAWMKAPPAVSPIRMFFVPHRLTQKEWDTCAIRGGVPFDRCRIAHHTPKIPSNVASNCAEWMEAVLNTEVRS